MTVCMAVRDSGTTRLLCDSAAVSPDGSYSLVADKVTILRADLALAFAGSNKWASKVRTFFRERTAELPPPADRATGDYILEQVGSVEVGDDDEESSAILVYGPCLAVVQSPGDIQCVSDDVLAVGTGAAYAHAAYLAFRQANYSSTREGPGNPTQGTAKERDAYAALKVALQLNALCLPPIRAWGVRW